MSSMMCDMSGPADRLLPLLRLLQTRRTWPGSELARRLEVNARTLRRDVERLRELGYRVQGDSGPAGGYRLSSGEALPPLLLSDDEAVAIAIGLRAAAMSGLIDGDATTLSALATLQRMLPVRLASRVAALAERVHPLSAQRATVPADLLVELAVACADGARLSFDYTRADGQMGQRRVEPHAVVAAERAFYLIGWDRDRDGWRTFRVDRMARTAATGARDPLRDPPAGDLVRWATSHGSPTATPEIIVVIDLPLVRLQALVGRWASGAEAERPGRCRWPMTDSSPAAVLTACAWLPPDVDFHLAGPTDLVEAVAAAATHLAKSTKTGRPPRYPEELAVDGAKDSPTAT